MTDVFFEPPEKPVAKESQQTAVGSDRRDRPVASERQMHSSVLAIAWMLAAIVGAGAITALSGQPVLRLLAPLTIMLFYLYFGLNSPGRNTAKLADSVYFLGFLWTLYALINEFIFLKSSLRNVEAVSRIFGYALVTTAFGMFVRLALLQFHHTASDQMEEARDDLDIRLEALTSELTRAHTQLVSWRTASTESMRAFSEELQRAESGVRTRIEGVHVNAALALAGTVKEAVLPLVEELRNVTPLTRKMRTAVSTLEKVTSAAADGLTLASGTFVAKLTENVDVLDKALSGNLGRASATLENAATNYASTIARQGDAVVLSLNTTAEASQKLLQVLTRLETTTAGVSGEVAAVKERIGALPQTVTEASVAIAKVCGAGIERVQTLVHDAAAGASSARDAAVALNKTVDEVLDFTRKRLL